MKRQLLTTEVSRFSFLRLPVLTEKQKNRISFTCAALLTLLFLYTGIEKLYHYKTFSSQLKDHPFFGNYANIIAWLLPSLELLITVALIYRRTRLMGFYSSFGLLLGFTAYIYILQHFFEFTPCHCSGVIENLSWGEHMIFNAGFMLIAITGACMMPEKKKDTPT